MKTEDSYGIEDTIDHHYWGASNVSVGQVCQSLPRRSTGNPTSEVRTGREATSGRDQEPTPIARYLSANTRHRDFQLHEEAYISLKVRLIVNDVNGIRIFDDIPVYPANRIILDYPLSVAVHQYELNKLNPRDIREAKWIAHCHHCSNTVHPARLTKFTSKGECFCDFCIQSKHYKLHAS